MILSVVVALIGIIAIAALVFAILAYTDGSSSPDGQSGGSSPLPGATSDACASSPCGGLATCTQVGPSGFACKCDSNYYGDTCTQVLTQGKEESQQSSGFGMSAWAYCHL